MFLNDTYKQKTKEALTLALPIIAGQLGQVLMGFFDTVQIGGLGVTYIAGSGFANNLYWITNLLGMGILFGVSTLVSEAFGEKNGWKAIGIYRAGIKVSLVLTAIFTVLLAFVIYNITIFGEPEEVNAIAVRFLRIMIFSTAFLFVYTAAKQLLDGMGRTRIGMLVTLGGLVLNVFLNWVMIYGNLGFPKMEIEGAAIATSVARIAMTVALLVIIWRDKQIRVLRAEYLQHPFKDHVMQILKIGIPTGLQFFWEVAAFGAAQIMSGWLGIMHQAAFQIAISLASVTFMTVTGFSVAGNILTGFQYGAKNVRGIQVAGNTVFMLTLAVEAVFAVLFLAFRQWLPMLYTDDAELIRVASAMLVFAAIFQISDGLQSVATGALRGIQDVRIPSIMAFVSYWLIMVPACYLLTFTFGMGLTGIWIGFVIGLTVAAVSLLWRFRWKTNNIEFVEV